MFTFPNHATYWSWSSIFNKTWKELFSCEILIMLLKLFFPWLSHFHRNKFKTSLFKLWDYLTDLTSLSAVWFNHYICSFSMWWFCFFFIIHIIILHWSICTHSIAFLIHLIFFNFFIFLIFNFYFFLLYFFNFWIFFCLFVRICSSI